MIEDMVAQLDGVVRSISWSEIRAYLAGCSTILLVVPLLKYLTRRITQRGQEANKIYALHHGVLNIELPPKSMWMNMGYWNHESDLPTACQNLLDEVLKFAGLVDQTGRVIERPSVRFIDLGIGCADQTIYLTQKFPSLISSYIGVTIDQAQFSFALQRLDSLDNPNGDESRQDEQNLQQDRDTIPENQKLSDDASSKYFKRSTGNQVEIFCEDAANPSCWSDTLKESTDRDHDIGSALWVLALDTLYHFNPSRKPLFDHAFKHHKASIMAFDLLLADEASLIDRFSASALALLMSCPMGTFKTKAEYQAQLVEAGYEIERIEMKDISEHVFSGLADFIEKRDNELKTFLGRDMGAYKVFSWVLRWWARTGVVRGYIVVARK